jgi:cytochrome c oxidase assembly protein subunit 11
MDAMKPQSDRNALQRQHRRVALWTTAVALAMVGAAYAASPLYNLLCQVTNFDGTPRRALSPSTTMVDKTISVRFDANVAPGFPWQFEPEQTTVNVRLGENVLAFYRARNLSDHAVKGTATYNVFPEQAAAFFNKVQCFCFTEQVLEPGQSVEFPVSFFVDPQIANDKDARGTTHITLSYTFYPVTPPKPGLAEKAAGSAPATPTTVPTDGRRG